jgi:hypothetical protein
MVSSDAPAPRAAVLETDAEPEVATRCVLFVHGVGEQRKSETLLYMGSPLTDWVLRWGSEYSGSTSNVGRVELSFAPYDVGQGDQAAYAVVNLPGQKWYLAEAWWAGSSYHPAFGTMFGWSLVHLGDILAQMRRATWERAKYLLPGKPRSSAPPGFWRLVDLINCLAVWLLYLVAAVVGYVLLIPLMLLSQIPIESVQNFIVLKFLRPFLTAGAGTFKLYLDDELQAANVRRRVADAAEQLLSRSSSSELIIIAHSEGAVVSLGMLTDKACEQTARKVRKLITLGAGLNKSWLVRPDLTRLFKPLTLDIKWTDIWASYDPVPAGSLDPGPRGKGCHIKDVYKPNEVSQEPESVQVTNAMNIITDHGGYFANEEQVLIRLAAEIAADDYTQSDFWPLNQVVSKEDDPEALLHWHVRRRRVRVSTLALLRGLAVGVWLASAVLPWWPLNWLSGIRAWGPLVQIPADAWGAGWVVAGLRFIRDQLPDVAGVLTPIADAAGLLLQLPAVLGLAALAGVVCWALYRLVVWLVWSRWDARERAYFLVDIARHAREQRTHEPYGALAG